MVFLEKINSLIFELISATAESVEFIDDYQFDEAVLILTGIAPDDFFL